MSAQGKLAAALWGLARRSGGPLRLGLSIAVVVIVSLAVLAVVVPWVVPSTASDPSAAPSKSAAAGTPGTFEAPGISLRLPAGWAVSPNDLPLHYEHVLAYVGTGTGSMKCGADFVPGLGGTCSESVTLGPDTIVVRISAWDGPPRAETPVNAVIAANPKASPATVAGQPAAVRDVPNPPYRADRAIEWTLTWPGVQAGSFVLTAYVKGPDEAPLLADLGALIASVELSDATSDP
jgi:hypothetical protein